MPRLLLLYILGLLIANGSALSKTQESQDILLEDSSKNVSESSDAIVNSITRDPFYRVLDQIGWDNSTITDYELGDLNLIGVVWDVPKPIAMFKAPKEKRFIVIVGDKIGKNNGVVMEISKGEVHVREIYTDLNGSKTEKSTIKRVEKRV